MYLRAVSATPEGKVSPEKYSSLLSAAWAMIEVPSTVARSFIFSAPMTMTVSYSPERMATQPRCRAQAPVPQAASTRTAGAGTSPRWSEAMSPTELS